ncbi:hypothetical protein [Pseudoalteromonas aliena]|uniref:Uncharacterized protein n=1 Tax=Pseudoalteromonas aliena SW19 TaxID=1314866 RepID=A0ABR9DXL2_9GAMM|nr:hypothetical protein [Pseudoalteromonas aliena]MBE0359084.1 hypothetical protein [Pseudoalteromonas aliena SW19]
MKYITLFSVLALSACSAVPNKSEVSQRSTTNMDLIALTEQSAPKGVVGTYLFHIKAAGAQGNWLYLNTETDYRDRRSITISIKPNVAAELESKYGQPVETFFIDKTIEVTGEAKRVTIDFMSRGRATNKYYYQTHINVSSLKHLRIIES